MSYGSWFLDETPLPKLGFLGQGTYGYVTLVRNGDGLLMAKKTCLLKYSEDLEKEVRIMEHFFSFDFNTVRATSPAVSQETMPVNVKVCSIHMEVAPHGSLKDMLTKAGGTLPENVIGYCIFQVLEGLRDLHQHGYVHCDLKPENILIFPSYARDELCNLKLGDFGLAKEPNGPDPVNGSLFEDNPEYLAPEAVGPRGVISSAVDIWSLGTMVMEMMGVTIRGRSDYVPGTLSPMTWDFVRRCRERNPEARATAEELMSHSFVNQSLEVPPLELLPVPSCLSNGVVQGRFF
ncbi:Protein kinase superfamily protein [Raphanus sativus]|uniref:Mitogen-activated protein kinase kinase kinase 20-like n=1 Tax=Raphanus sativus TaxID=3726 RepID=A0A9W3DIU6_RAPSA|nr:mitogen-activated protein kinase kinase kinase 20-like [Raphanus sativus]KAJ4905122.1 Protein kinase superfamily protein [Raphanus sativus]